MSVYVQFYEYVIRRFAYLYAVIYHLCYHKICTKSANYVICYIFYEGAIVTNTVGIKFYYAEYGLPTFKINDPPKQYEISVIFDFLDFFFACLYSKNSGQRADIRSILINGLNLHPTV